MQFTINGRTINAGCNRTRLAPTPSGFLHLGNVASFSVTAWLARKTGAGVLLRIDDLDRQRVNSQYIDDIFDTLHFLDIAWDEGPGDAASFEKDYAQLHRLAIYQRALQTLAERKAVFACNCSRSSLAKNGRCTCKDKSIPLDAENVSWRADTSHAGIINIKNIDGNLIQTSLPPEVENFIVRKKDGLPSYQLASVVDDLFYNADLIVRGRDLWPSTLAQNVLAGMLNEPRFTEIAFLHHPLLTEPSGAKMSKSAGAASIKYLREHGKKKEEIFETIARMLGEQPATNWQQLGEIVARCSISSNYP